MKPLPRPEVPGTTESERMDSAVRQMFSVPKSALLKLEAKLALQKKRPGRKRA